MAIFYRNRPDEHANITEKVVAEYLDRLNDDWLVVWGYYYICENGVQREGDFIILGPSGQILVMEVKGGQNRQFVLTGEWEGDDKRDNPLEQLRAQWNWAIGCVTAHACENPAPYVAHALCMPNINLTGEERLTPQFGIAHLIKESNLQNFTGWWSHHVANHHNRCPNPKNIFCNSFVPGQRPAPANLFIQETERILHRYRNLNNEYLEMLGGNARWVVEGGPGTGKSFLAMQRAKQLAEEGREILFICYNLVLAEQLQYLVKRNPPTKGTVTVKSWQEIIMKILTSEGLIFKEPAEPEQRQVYYQLEIPGYVREILQERPPERLYDALVVDEAQDHDTAFHAELTANTDQPNGLEAGWWSWYFALLKSPETAPVAIFLDPNQRPKFRDPELFNLDYLREFIGNHAHFRLTTVRRYTIKIDQYLRELPKAVTQPYPQLNVPETDLPTGPEVIKIETAPDKIATAIEDILTQWLGQKLCTVNDIVILGKRRALANSSIGNLYDIKGYPLREYSLNGPKGELNYLGIDRAKGLDFLGVILIDLLPGEQFDINRFAGATRARQLLGIISTTVSSIKGLP
jgi:hypothetical protein